jgi:hypothetical protein
MPTLRTLPDSLAVDEESGMRALPADRANESIGPTGFFQGFFALFFGSEAFLELGHRHSSLELYRILAHGMLLSLGLHNYSIEHLFWDAIFSEKILSNFLWRN